MDIAVRATTDANEEGLHYTRCKTLIGATSSIENLSVNIIL